MNELKTPLSFADQLYVLRDHVGMVRQHLLAAAQPMNHAKEISGPQ